ncbi:MAG: PD-(D/E)XK nuclease family protein, partial [Flavobacteriales bacterium]
KVLSIENQTFYDFISTSDKTIIDQEAYDRCVVRVQLIKDNKDVIALFDNVVSTDFELDQVEIYNEQFLSCETKDYKFGLKGYVDRYTVDHDKEEINIIDLKTTGKSISDFEDSIEFYNYWMQAAIYKKLVLSEMPETAKYYNLTYRFVVIDKYNQVYVFLVTDKTMTMWENRLKTTLDVAEYHCINNRYDLPYKFLTQTVTL